MENERMRITFALLGISLFCLNIKTWGQSFDPHPIMGPNALRKQHPSYDLSDLVSSRVGTLPQGFSGHIGGMAFMPNGKMAVCDFPNPSSGPWKGSVWMLDGVQTGDPAKIKYSRFHDGLFGPTGLTIVNGDVYVIDGNSLKHLTDKDSNGTAEVSELTGSWHQTSGQPAVADLSYRDGYFYSAFGSAGNLSVGGKSVTGGVVKIGMDSSVERLNTGFRNTGGSAVTAQGDIFATDNQGEWLPSSKLINVVKGRHYNFGGNVLNGVNSSPPAVWIPEGIMNGPSGDASKWSVGLSPSTILPIPSGPFVGQLLMGDIRFGNVHRAYLEKVQGEYQGALFHFSGGFSAGIYRMCWGPDGSLYLGGMGGSGYTWSWKDNDETDDWGLFRMKPNANSVFEMQSVSAKAGGFEMAFTLPVKAGLTTANFKVQSWRYVPTGSYGGPQVDQKSLKVISVKPYTDKKKLFLEVDSLEAGKVVHIEIDSNQVTAEDGKKPWTTDAWYTLNRLSTEPPTLTAAPGRPAMQDRIHARIAPGGDILIFSEQGGTYSIRDAQGTLLEAGVVDPYREEQSKRQFGPGLYFVSVNGMAQIQIVRF